MRRLLALLLVKLARRPAGMPPYAFHDTKGHAYYAWSDLSEMPRQRRLEVDTVMLWIDAGRPQKAIEEIGEAISKRAIEASEAKTKKEQGTHLAAIHTLAKELLMRQTLVPEECYYQLAAATCVREDETDPAVIDRHIHMQKVEEFRSAGRAGHAFFITPICKQLLAPLYTTANAWPQLLAAWIREAARHQAAMEILASKKE